MSRRRPRSKQNKSKDVICPTCGQVAITVTSPFGRRHLCCGLESYNGKPLVSRNVLRLRVLAHNSLDPLWQKGLITRSQAYKALAQELEIDRSACHIGDITDENLLKEIPFATRRIKFRIDRGDFKPPEPKQETFQP